MQIDYTQDGGIGRIAINRPAQRNALSLAMWQALAALLAHLAQDAALRCVLLTSATPGLFCAGADIAEMLANKHDAAWLAEQQAAINLVQQRLAALPMPTLAFIDGDAIGGGCGLTLACDIRIASPRARLGITPAKLGLVYPLHDVALLVDIVGVGAARRLLYTAGLIDAEEALRIHLVDQIAANPEPILAQIAANAPGSLRVLKGFVGRARGGQRSDDDASLTAFAEAFAGAEFAEGASAFVEKRAPRF